MTVIHRRAILPSVGTLALVAGVLVVPRGETEPELPPPPVEPMPGPPLMIDGRRMDGKPSESQVKEALLYPWLFSDPGTPEHDALHACRWESSGGGFDLLLEVDDAGVATVSCVPGQPNAMLCACLADAIRPMGSFPELAEGEATHRFHSVWWTPLHEVEWQLTQWGKRLGL